MTSGRQVCGASLECESLNRKGFASGLNASPRKSPELSLDRDHQMGWSVPVPARLELSKDGQYARPDAPSASRERVRYFHCACDLILGAQLFPGLT